MMVTDILHRVRSHLAMPGVTKAGLAIKAGLHPNTLRDADQESWNPTAATLRALEPHLPPVTAEWPVGSPGKDGEISGANPERSDSHRPFLPSSPTCSPTSAHPQSSPDSPGSSPTGQVEAA